MTTSKTPKTFVTIICLHTEHYITMSIEDAKDLELEDRQVVYPEQYNYIVSYLSNKSDTPTSRIGGVAMPQSKYAKLRVCAKCEWLFIAEKLEDPCPKCGGYAHYSARYVYGNNAYRYIKTQKPWMDSKMAEYKAKLKKEVIRL